MSVTDPVADRFAARPSRHESFLVFHHFRYLKIAAWATLAAIVLYIADQPYGTRYGGTWVGYILGVAGAALILWLTWFGYKKRTYLEGEGRLAARLSAHVYLGLALLIIATLHTGFHFDWNIHTLAYALMCIVIVSGLVGIFTYARYPRLMTENRGNLTTHEMLSRIASLNDEMRRAAVPLEDASATLVERAVETTQIGGSVWRQLSGRYPGCATTAAIRGMEALDAPATPEVVEARRNVRVQLAHKAALLRQIRRDIRYKAMMEIWLYVHVPITFALLAALLAHIVLVVFFLPVVTRG